VTSFEAAFVAILFWWSERDKRPMLGNGQSTSAQCEGKDDGVSNRSRMILIMEKSAKNFGVARDKGFNKS
jgi:hypothetical protein